ncbi:MAG: TonB-dependent receptor [Candidatus Magnetominusculus sp. LBB02]|nr:TonB-dependent receptor [Candidatus Magnetominusculus sp. LBB02]
MNGELGYKFGKNFVVTLEAFNIFNAKTYDIAYYYTSRLQGESAAGVNDVHFHPAEPFTLRLSAAYYF